MVLRRLYRKIYDKVTYMKYLYRLGQFLCSEVESFFYKFYDMIRHQILKCVYGLINFSLKYILDINKLYQSYTEANHLNIIYTDWPYFALYVTSVRKKEAWQYFVLNLLIKRVGPSFGQLHTLSHLALHRWATIQENSMKKWRLQSRDWTCSSALKWNISTWNKMSNRKSGKWRRQRATSD